MLISMPAWTGICTEIDYYMYYSHDGREFPDNRDTLLDPERVALFGRSYEEMHLTFYAKSFKVVEFSEQQRPPPFSFESKQLIIEGNYLEKYFAFASFPFFSPGPRLISGSSWKSNKISHLTVGKWRSAKEENTISRVTAPYIYHAAQGNTKMFAYCKITSSCSKFADPIGQ